MMFLLKGGNEFQSDDIPTSTQTPSATSTVVDEETVDNSFSFPPQIWQLSNLVKLSLCKTEQIEFNLDSIIINLCCTRYSRWFCTMFVLLLDDNGLKSLPKEIGKMIKMRNLDLRKEWEQIFYFSLWYTLNMFLTMTILRKRLFRRKRTRFNSYRDWRAHEPRISSLTWVLRMLHPTSLYISCRRKSHRCLLSDQNDISSIPTEIQQLTKLKTINLGKCWTQWWKLK